MDRVVGVVIDVYPMTPGVVKHLTHTFYPDVIT